MTDDHSVKNRYFYENTYFDHNYSLTAFPQKAPSYSFPTHWHNFGEIIYAVSGNPVFEIQEKTYTLQPGDVLFIWPGELHSTVQAEPCDQLIVQYHTHLLNSLSDTSLLQNPFFSRHYIPSAAVNSPTEKIHQHMEEILDFSHRKIAMANTRMCLSLCHILLLLYDFCSADTLLASYKPKNTHFTTQQAISKACCYISQHCDQDLTLDEVAAYVDLSKFHFSRSFREYTQSSFNDYLAKQRIQQAVLLFENRDMSIAEAAFLSGFGSIASFNRCFKKEKNCTPSEYRKLMVNP